MACPQVDQVSRVYGPSRKIIRPPINKTFVDLQPVHHIVIDGRKTLDSRLATIHVDFRSCGKAMGNRVIILLNEHDTPRRQSEKEPSRMPEPILFPSLWLEGRKHGEVGKRPVKLQQWPNYAARETITFHPTERHHNAPTPS